VSTSDRMKFVKDHDGIMHFNGWDGDTDGLDPVSREPLRKDEWVVMSNKHDVTMEDAYNLPVNFQTYLKMLKHCKRSGISEPGDLRNPLTRDYIRTVWPLDINGEIKTGFSYPSDYDHEYISLLERVREGRDAYWRRRMEILEQKLNDAEDQIEDAGDGGYETRLRKIQKPELNAVMVAEQKLLRKLKLSYISPHGLDALSGSDKIAVSFLGRLQVAAQTQAVNAYKGIREEIVGHYSRDLTDKDNIVAEICSWLGYSFD
jgi:hypothetical protein